MSILQLNGGKFKNAENECFFCVCTSFFNVWTKMELGRYVVIRSRRLSTDTNPRKKFKRAVRAPEIRYRNSSDIEKLKKGMRVTVWWTEEQKWFDGEVVANVKRQHKNVKIRYDDGDVLTHNFSTTLWKLIDNEKQEESNVGAIVRSNNTNNTSAIRSSEVQSIPTSTLTNNTVGSTNDTGGENTSISSAEVQTTLSATHKDATVGSITDSTADMASIRCVEAESFSTQS